MQWQMRKKLPVVNINTASNNKAAYQKHCPCHILLCRNVCAFIQLIMHFPTRAAKLNYIVLPHSINNSIYILLVKCVINSDCLSALNISDQIELIMFINKCEMFSKYFQINCEMGICYKLLTYFYGYYFYEDMIIDIYNSKSIGGKDFLVLDKRRQFSLIIFVRDFF